MTESRQQAEAEAREEAIEHLNQLYPGLFGNPYVPVVMHPPQLTFLGLHLQVHRDENEVYESLYGGAAGGGKSEAILAGAAQYVDRPEYSGVCIRRTYAQLSQAGALMDRAHKWWGSRSDLPVELRPHWNGTDKIFTFPTGARVKFGYHAHPRDDDQYQGAEYQYVGWDELTHWPDQTAYEWVSLSRVRRPEGSTIPLRALSASNPGGPGHVWVRDRFPGTVGIQGVHPYVPARLADNPSLDRASYERGLMRMHPTRRAQLLDGDWRAREPGDYFRSEWFGPLLEPEEVAPHERIRIRWWDLAASEREDAARTAGVLMSRLRSGVRLVEHAVAFRRTPGSRDAAIVRQAQIDGYTVTVGLEIEPGSGGLAQVENLSMQLRAKGYRVVWARPKAELTDAEGKQLSRASPSEKGKAGRADPVASCLERGYSMRAECPDTGEPWWGSDAGRLWANCRDGIRLVAGEWTQQYLDEIEGFPDATLMDQVDATTGAWAWLQAHPYGLTDAPEIHQPEARQTEHSHPEDASRDRRPALPIPRTPRHRSRHAPP